MEDIELSVIIPVYNTEQYFCKCIESVIESVKKINVKSEIIVINDGSTGNINELIKKYLQEYEDLIYYIQQSNRGRGTTRNLGISRARGKYISFVDSDDFIAEDMYIKMFEKINKEQSDMVICDFENIDYNNSEKNGRIEAKNKNIEDNKWGCFDELVLPSCCNKLIKKELFNNLLFPEDINYEDLATIPVVVLKAEKISYIPKALYKYVQNENSVMHEKFDINQLNLINALEIIYERIEKLDLPEEDCKKAQYMIYTRRFYEELLEKIMLSNSESNLINEFCKRIRDLDERFWKNEYFLKLVSSQGKKRKTCNKLLHKAIQKNNTKLLSLYLTKRLYYRFFSIKYTSNILT